MTDFLTLFEEWRNADRKMWISVAVTMFALGMLLGLALAMWVIP